MVQKLKIVAADLEKQELQALGGISSTELYCKLLAIYIHENDMFNAKFLWKRIPPYLKDSSLELKALWSVVKAAWLKDSEALFAALKYDWSENIAHIMYAVVDLTREKALRLISRAYSSISVRSLSFMIGLPPADAMALVKSAGWRVVECDHILPLPPSSPTPPAADSQGQLSRLSEFSSFLEC